MARKSKRKVNKNLVGLLTFGAIVLCVGVVALATSQLAQQDPRLFAEQAEAAANAGEYEQAVLLYYKAYQAARRSGQAVNETRYLAAAARSNYSLGKIVDALSLYQRALAETPRDTAILTDYLEVLWELQQYGVNLDWNEVRSRASTLREIDPDNLLAHVAEARALQRLGLAAKSEPILERAVELAPDAPRVAAVRAEQIMNDVRGLIQSGMGPEDEEVTAGRTKAGEILISAARKNPDSAQAVRRGSEAARQLDRMETGRELLDAGLAANPDSPELLAEAARYDLHEAQAAQETGETQRAQALVERALERVSKATDIEPAFYTAYSLRSRLMRFEAELDESQQRTEAYEAALRMFRNAINDTVGLKSLRAELGANARIGMITEAFELALDYYGWVEDPERKESALTFARGFLDNAADSFQTSFLTDYMRGALAQVNGDTIAAIQHFSTAERKLAGRAGLEDFSRVLNDRLARLYTRREQYGAAYDHLQRMLDVYAARGAEVPLDARKLQVTLLNRLERPREALDLAVRLLRRHPDDVDLMRAQASALAQLGRAEEAEQVLAGITGADQQTQFARARLAILEEDYATAERLMRQALAADPQNFGAMALLARIFLLDDRGAPGATELRALARQLDNPDRQRSLESYAVLLETENPEQREAKLRELIASIPDEGTRLAERYAFELRMGNLDAAQAALDELAALREDDPAILTQQFGLAIRRGDYERAESYIPMLARENVDRVGGALFRGNLALARGQATEALEYYREAARQLPRDADMQVRIAAAYLEMEPPRLEDALQVLDQALAIEPRDLTANKLRYETLERLGRSEEGVENLRRASRVSPNDPWVRQRLERLAEADDPRAGIARREERRESNPEDVENLLRLGQLYERVGETKKADEAFSAAVDVSPTDSRVIRNAATHYMRANEPQKAKEVIERFIGESEGIRRFEGRLMLARLYSFSGNAAAAQEAFDEAFSKTDEELEDPEQRKRIELALLQEMLEFQQNAGRFEQMAETADRLLSRLDAEEFPEQRRRTRLRRIEAAIRLQNFDTAQELMDAFLEDHPDDAPGLLTQAELYKANDEPDEALAVYTRAIEQDAQPALARYQRGLLYARRGECGRAQADLEEAKRLAPEGFNLAHRLDLARVYAFADKPAQAERELRALLELRPESAEIANTLVDFLLRQDKRDAALQVLARMAARQPQDPQWPLREGNIHLNREEYSAAVRPLQRTVELTGGQDARSVATWLQALARANRAEEAIAAYSELPEPRHPRVMIAAAEAYRRANQPERANELLRESLSRAARQSGVEVNVVTAVAQQVFPMETLERTLRELVASTPEEEGRLLLQLSLGQVLLSQPDRDADEVIGLGEELLEAAGDNQVLQARAWLLIAQGQLVAERYEEMAAAYKEVIRRDENNVDALNNLAYMLVAELDRPEEALVYAERLGSLPVARNAANVLDTVGWVYYHNEQYERAVQTLREAVQLTPSDAEMRIHLAEALAAQGQTAEARGHYQQVLRDARAAGDGELMRRAEAAIRELD